MDTKSGIYNFQLDKLWFTLDADLLRNALGITPMDSAHPFVAPPVGDMVINFVNNLGYPEELQFVSKMYVNSLYQPWRTILSMINQCLTGKTSDEEGRKKKKASPSGKYKQPARAKQHALAKQTKPVKEKTSKPSPSKKIRKGKMMKVFKGKRSDHLPKKKSTTDQYILQRRTLVTQDASTGPYAQPQNDRSANVVRDTPSPADAETGADTEKSNSLADTEILNFGEEQGGDISNTVALEERIVEFDEGQTRLYPGKTPESRPPLEHVLMEEDQAGSNPGQSHVVQARPNAKPMHKDFVATVYCQVHKSVKHTTEEHVHIENPSSSSWTLSSIKNLGKANVETEVEFMLTVPIYQASSSVLPLSTPIIDLIPPKTVSPPVQAPTVTVTTATTTTTTTTLPLPPPPPQQSTTNPKLVTHVSILEKICANFEKKKKLQDKTTQALSSRVYTLENHDLNLSEFEMKEILHDRMFESGSYRSHPEHTTLYNALELSMDHENREEFKEATTKSRKRCRDDQDSSLPPPKDSDQSKKKRHDSDALASKQPPVQKSSDDVYLSESEDTNVAHLLKIKTSMTTREFPFSKLAVSV
ncbi:hypothetical protein Tco_0391067 [Tanacetum coccineum]